MAAIEFRGVTKRFPDGTVAVDDLHLRIEDGEFMIFVGPSGCGKTTALRMVAGLEQPTSGEILVGDVVVNDLDPVDRDIAMVFQNYALYPHMTVRANIGFPLETQRLPRPERERRIAEAAALLGLEDLLDRKPRALSGGQRQRVAMGRAIVRHPQSFLMDEPLSNLDAKLRVQMRAELVKLHQRLGVTTLYVTHDQDEAMTLGQRVAVLDQGRDPAGRLARGALQPSCEHVRRIVHRQPVDELPPSPLRRRGGRLRQLPPCRCPRRSRRGFGARRETCSSGLRPEHFSDARDRGQRRRVPVTVEITEQLGSETLVYFRIDGVSAESIGESEAELGDAFVARLDPRTHPVPGERLQLRVDVERAHFFDPADGATLTI